MKRMTIWLVAALLGAGLLQAQSVSLKIGMFMPRLESDLWEINLDNLTFERADMVNTVISGEYEFYLDRHTGISLDLGSYTRTVYNEYRDYTYEDGSPIYQDISLRIVPVELNVKYYPLGHRYRLNPYIGLGGGIYAFTYEQWGDFINFVDGTISEGYAVTRRVALGINARLGLNFRFHSRIAFLVEGKYQHVKGRLSRAFQEFEPLDLSAFLVNAGLAIYFR